MNLLAPALIEGHGHVVQFYETDEMLAEAVGEFIGAGLAAGEAALLIATAIDRAAMLDDLRDRGFDVDALLAADRIVLLDADETLEQLMVDGLPDPRLFRRVAGAALDRATGHDPRRRVRGYGEMVDVLWCAGNTRAALRLEELWNDLQRERALSLLCSYAMASFYKESAGLRGICATHTGIGLPERSAPQLDAGSHTGALLAEVAHRIEVERALRALLHELGTAEDALRDNELRLRTITDALPVLISYIDLDRRYRFTNRAYEAWFGLGRDEIIGQPVRDILGVAAYQVVRARLEAAMAGETVRFEAAVPYRGGERFIEATYVPHRGASGRIEGVVALVSDASERRRADEARELAERRAQRLLRVTEAIAGAVLPEQVFAAIVDRVGEAIGAETAALHVVAGDGRSAALVRATGYSEVVCARIAQIALDDRALPVTECISTGQPVWIGSQPELLARFPHTGELVTPGRAYHVVCLPMVAQDSVLGALALTFDGAPPLDDDERNFLLLVARYSGQALERLRLVEAERQSVARAEAAAARLQLLGAASRAFSEAADDLGAVVDAIVDHVTRQVADVSSVLLVPESGDQLQIAALRVRDAAGSDDALRLAASSAPRIGEGIAGSVAATGRPVFLPVVDADALIAMAHAPYRAWVGRNPLRSVIAVPLRAHGRLVGVLTAIRLGESAPFDEDDLHLLEELADRGALALENARLVRDDRGARARAELLYRLARQVIAADRVEDVYTASLDALGQALDTRRAAILTFDSDGVMRFRAWRGLSEAYRGTVEGHSPWSRDSRDAQLLLVPDVFTDPELARYGEVFRSEAIGALAFIPLRDGSRLIGKFMVYYDAPRPLVASQLDVACAIADHVASAIARFAALGELRETVRFHETFAGILGHDLRNPLSAITTAVELAILQSDRVEVTKPLSRILSSSQRMGRMIEQLLDFTRARVGAGIPLAPAPIDAASIARQIIDEIEDAYPFWTLSLRSNGDTTGTWDGDRLAQVFSNLVGNAVQHGAPGFPVEVVLDGTAADRLSIEVRNMGAIPADVLGHMFEPLGRTARPSERSRGLGLGLFISREIVKAHGGTIEVRSAASAGTTFSIAIPR